MNKFRKKPVIIEAVQITDAMFDGEHPNPLHPTTPDIIYDPIARRVQIHTLEGVMIGNIGDWIIKGVKGEFYPCKPDIFNATYEAVNHPQENVR